MMWALFHEQNECMPWYMHFKSAAAAMFGPHVSRYHSARPGATIVDHLDAAHCSARAAGFATSCAAIFLGNPHGLELLCSDTDRAALSTHTEDHTVVAHSSYAAQPWGGDRAVIQYLYSEQRLCRDVGIGGLVLHLARAAVDKIATIVPQLLCIDTPDVVLYFETTSHRTPPQYADVDDFVELFRALSAQSRALGGNVVRLGVCVDTAHLWSSGINIGSHTAARQWLRRWHRRLASVPVMFHLNDAVHACGSGVDVHAPLLQGAMWGAYASSARESGLAAFTEYAVDHNIVCILERRPKEALANDYKVLRQLLVAL
jgi:endonuclease IV